MIDVRQLITFLTRGIPQESQANVIEEFMNNFTSYRIALNQHIENLRAEILKDCVELVPLQFYLAPSETNIRVLNKRGETLFDFPKTLVEVLDGLGELPNTIGKETNLEEINVALLANALRLHLNGEA